MKLPAPEGLVDEHDPSLDCLLCSSVDEDVYGHREDLDARPVLYEKAYITSHEKICMLYPIYLRVS